MLTRWLSIYPSLSWGSEGLACVAIGPKLSTYRGHVITTSDIRTGKGSCSSWIGLVSEVRTHGRAAKMPKWYRSLIWKTIMKYQQTQSGVDIGLQYIFIWTISLIHQDCLTSSPVHTTQYFQAWRLFKLISKPLVGCLKWTILKFQRNLKQNKMILFEFYDIYLIRCIWFLRCKLAITVGSIVQHWFIVLVWQAPY